MSTINANHLSVAYDQKVIINDLTINLPSQKITSLIGSNGCGKSTLLKALTRIIPNQKGNILIDGQDIAKMPTMEIAKKMALLPQVQDITDGISVYELVSFGRYPYQSRLGKLTEDDKKIIDWALEMTKTQELANQLVDQLSGGQKQRVWIAMALAQDTPLIFLDEPTTYLDINHQLEILELLRSLNKESQKTIIMVLHDLNLASRYSDYLVSIKDGKIAYQGDPAEIMTPEIIRDIFGIEAHLTQDPIYNCPILLSYKLI
ncbi:ABC transporter ATP-binding protein [Streptococcus uberis]|uniref:ABC transporter ATP-binding protein n=1 Tax=Streptococcus uberis TaxID=1349 RepID=UPI0012B5539B|nr:ABC transporter ATP-binding protein [Streptococcus uberis]MTB70305.1 ATP-binding cassette domain-containing protein [Streptococcus uberis]